MAKRRNCTPDDTWYPTEPSSAHRLPSNFRSRGSNQGVLVTTGEHRRQIFYESSGECGLFHYAFARGDVVDVLEQQAAVYRDDAGIVRKHYFDAILTMRDGTRKAVSYKPSRRADTIGFADYLIDLAARISPVVADEILLITERDLPKDALYNAALLHDCRRDPPGDADAAVLSVLATVVGEISIGDLRDATGYGGEAFRAIVRLIGSRRITTKGFAAITADTLVWAAGAEGAR
ncbi:hypothetical protein ASF53_11745 [Methylobacterium sp. Leaf123]|uniref:hypothetical protein n=1 Tax=Methylobacterium sp. Leaf123 TaxID=1736264 RepID=UPI000700DD47|nr:hypothetical protein [Methylobacterium sp. Leaf123]KQQ13639.1 hypothetical protein ASF53_11745 [Methylobacterium sp. Leaf123]